MNDYKQLMDSIPLPAGLNDRVLSAAGGTKRRSFLLPAAACALCILAAALALRAGEPPAVPSVQPSPAALTPLGTAANYALALPMEEGAFDGMTLTLGEEEYLFTTETLGTFINEDGTPVLAPVLAGETRETTPALYAVTDDSRFLAWPVAGSSTVSLSNAYGSRETPGGAIFHAGIDIPGERGLAITAAAGGTVTETGFDETLGNYLILDHGEGLTTLYGQCQEVTVHSGDSVEAGTVVALLGSTGMSTGPHLHFEVREEGVAQNPVAYFTAQVRQSLKMG